MFDPNEVKFDPNEVKFVYLTLFIPASETTDFYREGVISPPQKIRFSRSLECTKIDATSHT